MKIKPDTVLYIVSMEGVTKMTWYKLSKALAGGMSLDGVQIFTEQEEVDQAVVILSKRKMLNEIADEVLLKATCISWDAGSSSPCITTH